MTIAPDTSSVAPTTRDALEETLIGPSREMAVVRALVYQAAQSEATVLIEGETGTGKEIVAEALHALSNRRGSLVAVNLAELSQEMAEAELFGVVTGAYTGAIDRRGRIEIAHGGTLFLDEAADLPRAVQARLLRVLESGVFSRVGDPKDRVAHFRLVLAVQRSPAALVAEQRWRPDFLYRVGRLHLALPPLVARGRDVVFLANHFLARLGVARLPNDAHAELLEHLWPGNVRELSNAVERAVFLAGERQVAARDIIAAARVLTGGSVSQEPSSGLHRRLAPPRVAGDARVEAVRSAERTHVEAALVSHGFNVRKAAEALGISKAHLYRRLRELSVALPGRRLSHPSGIERHSSP